MRRRLTWLDVFMSPSPRARGQAAVAPARELTVHQGVELGRRIDCAWSLDRPRVSGDVVVVADGDVLLGG